jgi:hypothetical protein
MTQRDIILQELVELQSSLANAGVQNVYQVPDGYFDNLIEQVLNRIKALDTEDAAEELNYLSPLLSRISKQTPYSVPVNFFAGLAESIIASEKNGHQTAAEELETISPLLSGLKKEMPYTVPSGYFEELNTTINNEEVKPAAKVISITRQTWFRYAAAAVVIGFVAVGGVLFLNKKENIDPVTKSTEWVKNNMKKVSTDDIDKFVELTDEEAPVVASTDISNEMKDKNEIKYLIKDIPDKDIQDFLDETQTDEPGNNDDASMN